jgi:hypothetical protein
MSSPSVGRFARPIALLASLSIAIAACSSGAASTSAPPAASTGSAGPVATDPSVSPDDPVGGPTDPGAGSGSGLGGGGGGKLVIPHPGTTNPHPVAVERIEPNVNGSRVTARLTWTSGVEPCYVLDSVVVNRDGSAIDVTVIEGTTDPTAMCIEIAMTKSTIVDLGDLDPGVYTIGATDSQIPPVSVTVG